MSKVLSGMMEDVGEFLTDIIGLDIPDTPRMLEGSRKDYAVEHLYEEFDEFRDATTIEAQIDGLVDLAYVALGRLVEMGVSPGMAFDVVHEANMQKRAGLNPSRPNAGQDAVKPEGWREPDFSEVLVAGLGLRSPKILVIGHAQHGKDTVGEILRDYYSLRFTSSSMFCAEHVMMSHFDTNMGNAYGGSVQACFDDRANHRAKWYQAIKQFNQPDASALGRAIFRNNDVYVGLRSKTELHALKNSGVVDLIIWVDRSDYVPPEPPSSCTVEPWMADFVVDNNGSLEDLRFNVCQLMNGSAAL